MTATAHALVAGAIARAVPNPYLAIPLAFGSHFIMDAVPHWDIGTNWRLRSKKYTGALAIAETTLGITLTYFLFQGKVDTSLLLMTIAASEIPDWMESPWYIFFAKNDHQSPAARAGFWEKLTYNVYKTENKIHARAEFPFGLYTQIVTVAFFWLLLLK